MRERRGKRKSGDEKGEERRRQEERRKEELILPIKDILRKILQVFLYIFVSLINLIN